MATQAWPWRNISDYCNEPRSQAPPGNALHGDSLVILCSQAEPGNQELITENLIMSLFEESEAANRREAQPLAAQMRPATLDEFVGQRHFLGEGKLLRRLLAADRLGSVIFYGPPGTGKTTLARLLARESRSHFQQISAVASGVKELREILAAAYDRLSAEGQRTLLFVDEIHRFNKAQQDVLLPDVEEGTVILVGATTENPFFTVNSPLVSRSRIFQFQPLSNDDIKTLLLRALVD